MAETTKPASPIAPAAATPAAAPTIEAQLATLSDTVSALKVTVLSMDEHLQELETRIAKMAKNAGFRF